jgi:AcrR family transcriptional regulator
MRSTAVEADTSTRERLLAATAEVMGRNGMTKLSLSEVALQAGVSRPTLYRWFGSKKELLDAYVVWERLMSGPNGAESAATVVRVAISHYLVRSDDADDFLAQLRHAAGVTRRQAAAADDADTGRSATQDG